MSNYDRNVAKRLDKGLEMANFRWGLIAPVVNGLFPDESAAAYYRRIAENPIKRPDGSEFHYKPKTIERWKSRYDQYGFDALISKERSDRGEVRVLPDAVKQYVREIMEKYPKLGSAQIFEMLKQEGLAVSSVRTLQRFVKSERKMSANTNNKDRMAFEYEEFGVLWQCDTSFFPYIIEQGKSRRTYLINIVDDHTRMIVAAELFYEDNAYNFQKVLKKACSAFGICSMLYCDHGSAYENKQLSMICGSLGIKLIHAPIRDGAAKAKVERSFGTAKSRWIYGLDVENIHSLAEFNALLVDYVRKHNLEVNKSTGQSPIERYEVSAKHVRIPKSQEWLDEAFMNRVTRLVRKDATISIKPYLFDAPKQFIGQTVEIRYLPGQWDNAYIMDNGIHYPLRITNKNENARVKRDNIYDIDYTAGV